jgi:hypothetical protein
MLVPLHIADKSKRGSLFTGRIDALINPTEAIRDVKGVEQ